MRTVLNLLSTQIGQAPRPDFNPEVLWIVFGAVIGAAIVGVTVFMAVRIIREKRADKFAERKVIEERNRARATENEKEA